MGMMNNWASENVWKKDVVVGGGGGLEAERRGPTLVQFCWDQSKVTGATFPVPHTHLQSTNVPWSHCKMRSSSLVSFLERIRLQNRRMWEWIPS